MIAMRPLLFLDVDGPLNPYAANPSRRPQGYDTHRMRPRGWSAAQSYRPLRVWLNPDHGPALLALPFDLVWATTWKQDANTWISPVLGLPELPVADFDQATALPDPPGWRGLIRSERCYHKKTRALVDYAAGRPFAWVDDEPTDRDRDWIAQHHPAPALVHVVVARRGLLDADFEALAAWAATLSTARAQECA